MKKTAIVLAFSLLILGLSACSSKPPATQVQATTSPSSAPSQIDIPTESEVPVDTLEPIESNIPSELILPEESSNTNTTTDERGIPGLDVTPIILVLQSSYGMPYPEVTAADEYSASVYAYSYTSFAAASDDDFYKDVLYDYSITVDSDDEIIGATFGITSAGISEAMLRSAAELYFCTIALNDYDTSDTELLSDWFKTSLPDASGVATTITIGDATFSLYSMEGAMYWVDIAKTV